MCGDYGHSSREGEGVPGTCYTVDRIPVKDVESNERGKAAEAAPCLSTPKLSRMWTFAIIPRLIKAQANSRRNTIAMASTIRMAVLLFHKWKPEPSVSAPVSTD